MFLQSHKNSICVLSILDSKEANIFCKIEEIPGKKEVIDFAVISEERLVSLSKDGVISIIQFSSDHYNLEFSINAIQDNLLMNKEERVIAICSSDESRYLYLCTLLKNSKNGKKLIYFY